MMGPLRFVYMNLEDDVERRERFLEEFPGVDWWRFPACRGGLMWGEIARGLGLLGDLRRNHRGRIGRKLWGNVGCSISHVMCLKMATVAGGIVLFPDDAVNPAGHVMRELVAEALEHRPAGCGWIKLKNHFPLYAGPRHRSGGWEFRQLARVTKGVRLRNAGSAAVIILREQARAILRALPAITSNGIDYEFRALVDRVPGGCWVMMGTGIGHREEERAAVASSRRKINKQ